jgi:hypothetical protein
MDARTGGASRSASKRCATPISKFQSDVLRLLAAQRSPDSYNAGEVPALRYFAAVQFGAKAESHKGFHDRDPVAHPRQPCGQPAVRVVRRRGNLISNLIDNPDRRGKRLEQIKPINAGKRDHRAGVRDDHCDIAPFPGQPYALRDFADNKIHMRGVIGKHDPPRVVLRQYIRLQ